MPRRRFRHLERGPDLKVEGGADEPASHFCQACETEVTHDAQRCYHCGCEIGGPAQADFDQRLREREATRRAERERAREARSQRANEEMERARLRRALEEQGLLLEEDGDAPRRRLPADLGVVVVGVCLFGTVSAILHLYLSAMWSDSIHWNPIAEVAIAVLVTWSAFQYLK